MRRPILNLVVFVIFLTLTLSAIALLPVSSQDRGKIILKLEELRSGVEDEHPALENKVNAVIHQVLAGAYNGALNKLENDVKKSITAWVEEPEDLIKLVDDIMDLIRGIMPPPPPPSPDFKLSADPDELEIEQNSSGISTIKVKSLHGFSQRVNLSATLSSTTDKVSLTLNPTWVIPTSVGNTSTLMIAVAEESETREHVITVAGTNGTTQRIVNITLVITELSTPPFKDFSIEASPDSLTIQQGSSDVSIITVTSLKGFSRQVDLTLTSQSIPKVNITLNPLQVFPLPNKTAISILTLDVASTATIGSYTITVQGTSGLLQRSIDITLEVTEGPSPPPPPPTPDFSLIAYPDAFTLEQGDSATSTIIVVSRNGFKNKVDLALTSEPIAKVSITLEPSQVTPEPNSFATSTLTITVATTASPSEHAITIQGKSGILERSVKVSLKVILEKTAPRILSVLRQPEKPSYNQTVTVLASVTDVGSGVKDVILSYSGGTTWKNETMTFTDGFYRATVPAFAFNTMVSYRVYAVDNSENWAVPSSVHSYVVADPYPPTIGDLFWSPEKPEAYEKITVNVIVTEPPFSSGVKNVTLLYSNTTMDMWLSIPMTMLQDGNWTATLTNQSDTVVTFVIEAYDNAENKAESEEEYDILVAAPPGFPLALILLIILILAVLTGSAAYLLLRRRQRRKGAEAAPPVRVAPPPSPPPMVETVKRAEKPSEVVESFKGYGMVSFVVPACNEEGRISQRIAKAYERAARHAGSSEIIVVDDGSVDNTYEVAWLAVESQRKKWPHVPVKVVKLSANMGREEAVRVGRSKATGEFVETVNGNNHAVSNMVMLA